MHFVIMPSAEMPYVIMPHATVPFLYYNFFTKIIIIKFCKSDLDVKQTHLRFTIIIMNSVTLKVAANHELTSDKPAHA